MNLQRTKLIIQREYTVRVRKKSFLLMSVLGPVFFLLMMIVPAWLATLGQQTYIAEIVDDSGLFMNSFDDSEKLTYIYKSLNIKEAKSEFQKSKHDLLVYIPKITPENPKGITLFSQTSVPLWLQRTIERKLRHELEKIKLQKSGISQETIDNLKVTLELKTITFKQNQEAQGSSESASIVGYVSAFLMYMFVMLYGVQTMKGVIEEKSGRIVEVMMCAVKPFELMMGKIIGIAGVALTQILIWATLTLSIFQIFANMYQLDRFSDENMSQTLAQMPSAVDIQNAEQMNAFLNGVNSIDIALVLGVSVFYFFGGYLFYGALFGAVGAISDNDTDSQQFTMPITIPLIIGLITVSSVLTDPTGSVAFWFSMIPFTSPVVMPARVPFIGANWELFLSMFLLIVGFIGTVWLAGRVYRIGILMYGKKLTYKELYKWIFYKP